VTARERVKPSGGGGVGLDERIRHGDGEMWGERGRWTEAFWGGDANRPEITGLGCRHAGLTGNLFLGKTRPLDGDEMSGAEEVRRFSLHWTQMCSIYQ
jgi:hypothetical protein